MDEHRAVGLQHQQARRLGQEGREAAGVGDLAAGDDQAHRANPTVPFGHVRRRFRAVCDTHGALAGGIPREVEEFIRSTIVSIQQLDVLLLVSSDETREWAPAEVGSILKTNADAAGTCLRALAAAGLVTAGGESFRYAPSPADRDVVARLALVYRTYRTRVIQMVYSRPDDAISTFADAFRLRRKER